MKSLGIVFLVVMIFCAGISAQTTAFTYQGSMQNSGTPANGNFDFEFKLFDAVSAGAQQGSTLQRLNVAVANGIFTVTLDFGAGTLPGANRFLDIAVRTAGGGAFTPLTPRQQVDSAPYSVRSLNSNSADTVAVAGVPSGSGNYIQNTTAQQASSNFNISGKGEANILTARTQYDLGSSGRVLGVAGADSVMVGINAGMSNVGTSNSFFGNSSGFSTTTGNNNSFFGAGAGQNNTIGGRNSFFGQAAGYYNAGSNNSFFGSSAGQNNSGNDNSFFGIDAGLNNTTGGSNSFFGKNAGISNSIGQNITLIGSNADVVSGGLFNATAIGFNAVVAQNNSLILGNLANVGIGTSTPPARLTVSANTTNSTDNTATFTAPNIGPHGSHIHYGTNGDWYIRSAHPTGKIILQDTGGNVGIGANAADFFKLQVTGNTFVDGFFRVGSFSAVGNFTVCRNLSNDLASCSSSIRYKTNIANFLPGMSHVNKLTPITFNWKDGGMRDLGFVAEEVEKIDPLLVTYNDKGEIEGVKYDRLSVTFVNAFKEQQEQIETLQKTNTNQQKQIDELKAIVCAIKADAEVCRNVVQSK